MVAEAGQFAVHPAVSPRGVLPCQSQHKARISWPTAGHQGGEHGPAGGAEDVADHHRQLDLGIFEQFPGALLFPGPFLGQGAPVAGQVAQLARRDEMNEARSMPRSASLHSQTASRSVLGRPGTLLTSRALTTWQVMSSSGR